MSISLAFRDSLAQVSQVIVDELDQLVAGIKGFLLVEHKEDGTHSDITADSILIASEHPFFGFYRLYGDVSNVVTRKLLEVTAGTLDTGLGDTVVATLIDSAYLALRSPYGELQLGGLAVSGPVSAAAPGVVWSKGWLINSVFSALTPTWAVAPFFASSGGSGTPLGVFDKTNTRMIAQLCKNFNALGASTYMISPDTNFAATTSTYLGDRRSATAMWAEVAGLVLYALNGVVERGRTVALGEWVSPAFNAAHYTANGSMTWTVAAGDVATMAYTLIGKTMTISFALNTTSVGGTPNTTLQFLIPGGFVAAKEMRNTISLIDNGLRRYGQCAVQTAGTQLQFLYVQSGSVGVDTWTATTDNTGIKGQLSFEVQ